MDAHVFDLAASTWMLCALLLDHSFGIIIITAEALRLEDFVSRVQEPRDLEDDPGVKGENNVGEGRYISLAGPIPQVKRWATNGKISANFGKLVDVCIDVHAVFFYKSASDFYFRAKQTKVNG